MKTEIIDKEIYVRNSDGSVTLVKVEKVEADVVPTQEEIIADKEAALLAMYEELQALKQSQQS